MVLSDSEQTLGESSEGEETPEMQEYVAQEVGMADGRTTIDEASVARAFRSFHQFVAGLSSAAQVQIGPVGTVPAATESGLNTEKELERREVYRNYFKFISLLLLPEGHPDRPIPRKLPSFKPEAGRTISVVPTNSPPTGMMHKAGTAEVLKAELKVVEHVYEEYLLRGLNFPRADEYHGAIGEWVDLVVQDWRVAGGSGEEAPAVVEILYRAATKTFHSPRILRHLFTALTAVGNFPDAVRSLDTYVDLVQRAKDRISKGHIEKDIDDDKTILETTVEGIRVLCGLVGDAGKGMALAGRIERWIDEWRVRDDDMLASVYRGIGTANATWARHTIDGDSRPDIQRAAVRAFEKALTHDQFDIDVWYGLALVQLEVGDIDSAMESTKKGLVIVKYLTEEEFDDAWDGRRDYKRRTVPLLHLLSLLMTVTENFEEARQACANVFEILGEDMSVFRGMGIGEKESVLEVRMTQIAIEEALDGVGVAVKMADHLLDIYGRLFEAAQLDHSSRSLHDNGQLDNPPPTRPNTTNRKPRLLGGRRKSMFSTTVSSLPPEEFIGDSGSIRPISGHQSLRQSTGLGPGPDAPQIQVTDVHGGAYQNDNLLKKTGRPSSVSSGTIRRMKSFSSMRSGKGDHGRMPIPDVPTPPLPSGTNTSSASVERSPAGSVKENHHHNTHLFQMLKLKLHKHQLQDMGTAGSSSEPLSHIGSTTSFMTNDSSITPMDSATEGHMGREAPRAEDIPNNLSQSKLPYPIRALRSGITDEIGKDAKPRSIRRPKQLPEPKLHEEDEKRRALAALRKVWIFIGGLARRSKDFGGATYALDEASALIGLKGEGEADVLTEVRFLITLIINPQ
jgi:tetratricopeptide (TPR) repeat protein